MAEERQYCGAEWSKRLLSTVKELEDTDLDHLDHKKEAEGERDEHQEHGAQRDEAGEVARHLALALALCLTSQCLNC